ncbi:MAG: hypothetical protein MJ007_02100 [Paludibacteraceae bacterium]|nr:hypothetical protein [Paludibacteraceae bacterium]
MEKAEQEYDAREYELAQEYSRGYEQGRADTIDECIDKFAEIMSNMYQICGRSCPVNCNWGTTTSCKDMCKKWLFEQLKEQK